MGTRIESVATAHGRRGPWRPGALHLSDEAARECLARGGRRADEVDLLVNAGLYKDKNLAEPALASIIQEDIGANPGHPARPAHHGTFSFDVMNGGCGVLTAAQLIDSFVRPGSARLGLIVAADVDPAPRTSVGFTFPPVGGAVLLAHVEGVTGFRRFEQRTFAADADLFEARVRFEPGPGGASHGHGHSFLEVREDPRFALRCLDRALETTAAFLNRAELRPQDIDLLVASQYPVGFAKELARGLGIAADRVPVVPAALAGAYTAGPLAALEVAFASGRLATASHTLFVTAGAGITIATALYGHQAVDR